jgi:hypothetical protein
VPKPYDLVDVRLQLFAGRLRHFGEPQCPGHAVGNKVRDLNAGCQIATHEKRLWDDQRRTMASRCGLFEVPMRLLDKKVTLCLFQFVEYEHPLLRIISLRPDVFQEIEDRSNR